MERILYNFLKMSQKSNVIWWNNIQKKSLINLSWWIAIKIKKKKAKKDKCLGLGWSHAWCIK